MIPRTSLIGQRVDWRKSLAEAITSPKELIKVLQIEDLVTNEAFAGIKDFPLRVPHGFAARMKKGTLNCPLLKQILPLDVEQVVTENYSRDPLFENKVNPSPGLLHKYQGRILLTATGACAVHCRYCFRRYFPYSENNPGTAGWQQSLEYIAKDSSISEVILSGGDPFILPDKQLQWLSNEVCKIPHVTTLRFHTRIPVVLPERITTEFLEWWHSLSLQKVLVLHSNHANEFNEEIDDVLNALQDHKTTLLNQAVLLRGINDSTVTLVELSRRLFKAGVLPYYLHLLDKVQGTAHFDIPESQAHFLHLEMQAELPGYLVPRLVREVPGAASKVGSSPSKK